MSAAGTLWPSNQWVKTFTPHQNSKHQLLRLILFLKKSLSTNISSRKSLQKLVRKKKMCLLSIQGRHLWREFLLERLVVKEIIIAVAATPTNWALSRLWGTKARQWLSSRKLTRIQRRQSHNSFSLKMIVMMLILRPSVTKTMTEIQIVATWTWWITLTHFSQLSGSLLKSV